MRWPARSRTLVALALPLGAALLWLAFGGERPTKTPKHGKMHPNRLIHEKSPYLLQHAYNPVDWYPWGEEAFEAARRQNRPIFLSIGYSTCHWCHVMERESFSNDEIAALLNANFIAIKVDREERPDIDQVYMRFVQALTGSGGWPMSVFLTPERQPFFGGTYFPPQRFRKILQTIAADWSKNHEEIVASADQISQKLRRLFQSQGAGELKLEEALLDRTFESYASSYDSQHGGFGQAPKFPRPVSLNFLLRYWARRHQQQALEMVLGTLEQMARGGMHDHLGGGFHRYSTDERWFLPHFEKMLYDQAQLAVAYLEAYQVSHRESLSRVAEGTLDYVLRDMTGPQGGFYSAEDADSPVGEEGEETREGAFYVWTRAEIDSLLGQDADLFSFHYGVRKEGNVATDPFGEFRGRNVLFESATLEETARHFGISTEKAAEILGHDRTVLFQARSSRRRPARDDKILTSWNGLMISALARGYQVLGEQRYLEAARADARLIRQKLYDPSKHELKRRLRQGEAAIPGMLDDYAFLTQGLIDLYEASFEDEWLLWALDLMKSTNRLFWDEQQGGYFDTPAGDTSILYRGRQDYDGAEPTPNSVAALDLLRLGEFSGGKEWQERAGKTIESFQARLSQAPSTMPQMMVALDFYLGRTRQILLAGRRGAPDTEILLGEIRRRFLPRKILFLADGGPAQQQLSRNLEVLETIHPINGRATAYICEGYVCQLPTSDPATVARLLDGK